MTNVIRLCLDLNIWCAALIAEKKQKRESSCQLLVKIIRQGFCNAGPVQLIISWGMLNRLRIVLERDLEISPSTADLAIDTIKKYSELGPGSRSPQLTLGGTGVIALSDQEDAHVIETAIAGSALAIVTANFKDFISKDTQIIVENRHAIYSTPNTKFHIVHPFLMIECLQNKEVFSTSILLNNFDSGTISNKEISISKKQ